MLWVPIKCLKLPDSWSAETSEKSRAVQPAQRRLKTPPKRLILTLYKHGLAPVLGRMILLLTTTGRQSGLARVTPLQYEYIDGFYYVGSARGISSDWVKNILANPLVSVRIKNMVFSGKAEVICEPKLVADFIEVRLKRHPRMISAILKMDGITEKPTRPVIEKYAENLVMVKITCFPDDEDTQNE